MGESPPSPSGVWQRDETWVYIVTQVQADAEGLTTWDVNGGSAVCRVYLHPPRL
ncbi:protein of unknown function [Streptomyces sp. KY75]|nr:protein of unknown function [Streptomyces sp. KY75]CAD5991331.1 protein of unknown function [Streptomyces sp. KY70]